MNSLKNLLIAFLLTGLGLAQAQTSVNEDPPSRVARLSDVVGQVWYYSPDNADWIAAVRNQPVTSGDRIATDAGARAELELGSTTLRLDSTTELEVLHLDDAQFSTQLHDGSIALRVRDPAGAGQFLLNTDEGRFAITSAGSYRFDRSANRSIVTVTNGRSRYEGPNSALAVGPGQRAEFWIDSGGVAQYNMSAPVFDAFAAWSSERDRRVLTPVAVRYVSPEMTGVEDLDRYGRWEQSPDNGPLWIPTSVPVGWAPYSNGHWAWVQPWGWTWIDDAPWGFAPFHYGRWVYAQERWCWTPGQRVIRPVYAPALVAWVGGPRVEVGLSFGGGAGRGGPPVGWFPLAPREVYVPAHQVSPRYIREVNITNVTNVTVINNVIANPQAPREYNNRRFPHALTVVPSSVMTSRQPVGPAAEQARREPWAAQFANAQPGRAPAMLAPPVERPAGPAQRGDPRGVRLPPGAAPDARGEPMRRPDFSGRDRDQREPGRGRDQRDVARPAPPNPQTPPAGGLTTQPAPAFEHQGRPGLTPPPATAARPANEVQSQPQPQPEVGRGNPRGGDERRGGERPAGRFDNAPPSRAEQGMPQGGQPNMQPGMPQVMQPGRPAPAAPVVAPSPNPAAPTIAPAAAPAPAPAATPERSNMRPMPIRGEDRRMQTRGVEPPPAAEPRFASPHYERPSPPPQQAAPAAVEAPQPVRAQRPPEPPRVMEAPRAMEPPRVMEPPRAAPPPAAPPPAAGPREQRRPEGGPERREGPQDQKRGGESPR